MFCSLLYAFHFVGDKIASDSFKDETTPLLKSNDRLRFSQDVAMNNVKEKGKPQCKLPYKLFKE